MLLVFPVVPAYAIELVSVELGILVLPQAYPCPVKPRTSQWAINDWDTVIVVQLRDIREGDRVIAEITVPNSRVFRSTTQWSGSYSAGCSSLFMALLLCQRGVSQG